MSGIVHDAGSIEDTVSGVEVHYRGKKEALIVFSGVFTIISRVWWSKVVQFPNLAMIQLLRLLPDCSLCRTW